MLFDQPAFWKQAESQVNACLASVKDYENRQRQEQREQKDAAFRDQQRQHVERMQQDQALRDQQRRLREKTDEQAQLTRQQAERDLAFENYERRLNGLPERERKKTATEELYLRGKEGKDLKDAVDEVYEAYTDTATMTMRGVGKAVGAGILDGLSPGLPPYPEAGSAYVDEDPERAKAVDEKVRKQRRASDRWLKEMERKEKEQNPYYPLPWPPPNDGPEIKAAP
ncbi:MAG: hypothetical protein HP491_15640 [Nitrospira sp.]|nr:hypothetical protein [Nitrospira sp.]MBH0183042.1 hypothetical protein [Nitrospira sp.]